MNHPSENPVQPQQPQTQFQNLQANAQMHVTANIPGNLPRQDRPPYCPEQSPPASAYPSAVNGYAPYQAPYGGNPYAAYPLQGQQVTTVYYTGSGYNGQNTPAVQPPAAPFYSPPAAPPQETILPYGSSRPYHQPVSYGQNYGQGGYRPVPQDRSPQSPAGPGYGQPYQQPNYPPRPPAGGRGYPVYPPQGQSPVYNVISRPVYAPPVDLTKPLMVTGSRRVTPDQYKRLNQLRSGLVTGFVIVALALAFILGIITILLSNAYETSGFILTIVLATASEAAGIILAAVLSARRGRAIREAYACAEAAGNGESVLEIYHDRVESVSSRGRSVVPFLGAVLWETSDMLILVGQGGTVVWRAEDVTPQDGRTVNHILIQRVGPGFRRTKEPFVPCAPFPMPLPTIRNDDEVRTVVRTVDPGISIGKTIDAGLGRIMPILVPLFTILGLYLSVNFAITPSFTVDIVLFVLLCWCIGFLLVVGILALAGAIRRNKYQPVDREMAYAFTRDGMAWRRAGVTVFIPHAYIKKKLRTDGVELKTPYGKTVIYWEDAQDPAALQEALNLSGPNGWEK